MIIFAIYFICFAYFLQICLPLEINCERANVVYYNPDLFANAEVTCYPYNRTLRLLNITLNFRRTPGLNDDMNFKMYALLSNRYVLTGMQTTIKWKRLINYPYFGIKRLIEHHTVPSFTKWPVQPREFKIFNIYVATNEIPLNMPLGKYKAKFTHLDNKEVMMLWHYYVRIN